MFKGAYPAVASAVEHALASVFHSGGPVPLNHARMLWFSGLRGAMAFALALEAAATRGDDGRAILTGVLGAVVFTTLVVGGLTTRALGWLGISTASVAGAGAGGREAGREDLFNRRRRRGAGRSARRRRPAPWSAAASVIDARTIDRVRTTTTPRPGRERS